VRPRAANRFVAGERSPRVGGDTLSLQTEIGLAFGSPIGLHGRPSGESKFINAIRLLTLVYRVQAEGGWVEWRAELIWVQRPARPDATFDNLGWNS
jgi:hypothetical protein